MKIKDIELEFIEEMGKVVPLVPLRVQELFIERYGSVGSFTHLPLFAEDGSPQGFELHLVNKPLEKEGLFLVFSLDKFSFILYSAFIENDAVVFSVEDSELFETFLDYEELDPKTVGNLRNPMKTVPLKEPSTPLESVVSTFIKNIKNLVYMFVEEEE